MLFLSSYYCSLKVLKLFDMTRTSRHFFISISILIEEFVVFEQCVKSKAVRVLDKSFSS